LCLSSIAIVSCQDKKEEEIKPEPPPGQDSLNSNLIMVNAHSAIAAYDFYLKDIKINPNPLLLGENTAYVKIGAGFGDLSIFNAGSSSPLTFVNFNFLQGEFYSVYAIGANSNVEPLIVEDDLTTPEPGFSRIRFIHLSADAPSLDLFLDTDVLLDQAFNEITYKEYTDFIKVTEGVYDLKLRNSNTFSTEYDLNPFTLESGKIYTLYIYGQSQTIASRLLLNQ
jgi:hypothetical protein